MSTIPDAATLLAIADYLQKERGDWVQWEKEFPAITASLPIDGSYLLPAVQEAANWSNSSFMVFAVALGLRVTALASDWAKRDVRYPDLTHSVLSLEQQEAHELLSEAMEGMGG